MPVIEIALAKTIGLGFAFAFMIYAVSWSSVLFMRIVSDSMKN